MNRKHPEWIPRDDHAWLGWTGLDPGVGGWMGGFGGERRRGDGRGEGGEREGGCEALPHPAGLKEKDRRMRRGELEREKRGEGPRALTGVALHSSWGLSADLNLWIFPRTNLCLSLPVRTHAFIPRVMHTWQVMVCYTMISLLFIRRSPHRADVEKIYGGSSRIRKTKTHFHVSICQLISRDLGDKWTRQVHEMNLKGNRSFNSWEDVLWSAKILNWLLGKTDFFLLPPPGSSTHSTTPTCARLRHFFFTCTEGYCLIAVMCKPKTKHSCLISTALNKRYIT